MSEIDGLQFISEFTSELIDAAHTECRLTHAHTKEENGLVERANKEVSRHTTAVVFDTLVKNRLGTKLSSSGKTFTLKATEVAN